MKTLPRARKRRPLPEPPMTALCVCGHDYGSHDGKRCTHRTGPELTCACLGFKLAILDKPIREVLPRAIVPGAWRAAGDAFIAERAARLRGAADLRTNAERARVAADGKHTKGDSLLLLRIATALERIADSLEVDEENAQGSYVVGLAEIIDRKAVPR
jgi:hypothetical protein